MLMQLIKIPEVTTLCYLCILQQKKCLEVLMQDNSIKLQRANNNNFFDYHPKAFL